MKRLSFVFLSPALTAIGNRFGFDAHYFAKNSTLVLLGHAVTVVRGLVTGYLVARLFQKDVYGSYQFMLSILGMLSLFGLPGLAHSVTRAWARGDAFSLQRVTKSHLMACLIASAFLLLCIPFLQLYDREEFRWMFLISAILFPLAPIAMVHFGGYTVGKSRFDLALKANIVSSCLMILATLGIIFFHQSAVPLLIVTMSVPSLVYVYYCKNIRSPANAATDNTPAIVQYGWRLTFASLPVDLVWYIDKLLISHFFGVGQLAIFSVAMLIPDQVKQLAKQFLPVTFAKQAAGEDSRKRRAKLLKAVLIGTIVFAFGIALYILLCPFVIPLLFPNYLPEAQQIVLLTSISAGTLITVPGGLFAQYLEAQGMLEQVKRSNWIAALIFGISLFILIPMYGLIGAAIARGVFRLLYWSLTWWYVMRAPLNFRAQPYSPKAPPIPT